MKKIILFAAILFAGVSVVKAEGGVIGEGDVKVTLTLQPFQSIVIGGTGDDGSSTGNNVNLVYKDATDYSEGVTTTMKEHLSVVAAGRYAVKVKAKTGVFNQSSGGATYDVSNITLTAKANTEGAKAGSSIDLSTTEATLIASDTGTGTGVTYDVAYKGAGDNQYVEMLKDNAETIYTTEITYTIVAE